MERRLQLPEDPAAPAPEQKASSELVGRDCDTQKLAGNGELVHEQQHGRDDDDAAEAPAAAPMALVERHRTSRSMSGDPCSTQLGLALRPRSPDPIQSGASKSSADAPECPKVNLAPETTSSSADSNLDNMTRSDSKRTSQSPDSSILAGGRIEPSKKKPKLLHKRAKTNRAKESPRLAETEMTKEMTIAATTINLKSGPTKTDIEKERVHCNVDIDIDNPKEQNARNNNNPIKAEPESSISTGNHDQDTRYKELLAYKLHHGNANVPQKYEQNPKLGRWVNRQRQLFKKQKLSQRNIDRLRKIGFEFDGLKHPGWKERYAELKAYIKEHGTTCEHNSALGNWVLYQRRMFKQKKLSKGQIASLRKLGFEFSLRDHVWDIRYAELRAYAKEHGNANVPEGYRQNPALHRWVKYQREAFKEEILSLAQIGSLRKLGFAFSVQDHTWDVRYAELLAYAKEHGNAGVLQKYEQNPKLGRWVQYQRKAFKDSTLSRGQIGSLRKLGFEFSVQDHRWDVRYTELVAYTKKHGNIYVPLRYDQNPALANWIMYQRKVFKDNELSQERITRLSEINFDFSL